MYPAPAYYSHAALSASGAQPFGYAAAGPTTGLPTALPPQVTVGQHHGAFAPPPPPFPAFAPPFGPSTAAGPHAGSMTSPAMSGAMPTPNVSGASVSSASSVFSGLGPAPTVTPASTQVFLNGQVLNVVRCGAPEIPLPPPAQQARAPSTSSGPPVDRTRQCRHFYLGSCERRRCRFSHDPTAPPPLEFDTPSSAAPASKR